MKVYKSSLHVDFCNDLVVEQDGSFFHIVMEADLSGEALEPELALALDHDAVGQMRLEEIEADDDLKDRISEEIALV